MATKVTITTDTASNNFTVTSGGQSVGVFELVDSGRGPGGITQITSTTAPSDTSVIWLDPESGVQSVYSGGGWVTQLIVTIDGNAVKFDNRVVIFAGQQLTF